MDSQQNIDLGGTALAAQAYAPPRIEPAAPLPTEDAVAPSGATATRQESRRPNGDGPLLNPRMILDPKLYVNVAKYSFNNGSVQFQVPSRDQLEAYQRNQDAQATVVQAEKVEVTDRKVVEKTSEVQQVTDGEGPAETQASGIVAASVVSQTTTVDPSGASRADTGRPAAAAAPRQVSAPGQTVELEA
ncbi:hypothetical protein [Rhodospirillum rubrum]|uniref:Uncharacterized protein n=1 Tax=Rhodospirillum rubrum (strain ATCC 11170 / ATH 1.1.1 / DSM 467 / LMG 4362 / NCIMB 8255 / S1) TaxID=269796 RepID=Q2RQ65_RHORT|nr:hypothetical protein [Rhodospirillum rubrum]ABC23730.1 hypothetical protein Rru_A2933 [Rhodospirillum rubrum ATCC 11170]AEO49469.1 hypothetical protein F11_15035 [Rhodospirillum rubrum F11]MBK5955406.1 hypothetical protein [Rhodospirillum rubrum]QXG79686.1 hypothetical protein KUL73_15125 [Rhodospirillum rubrum]HCF19294.1 hypothetical protein [Rhodospirillum rubrum]